MASLYWRSWCFDGLLDDSLRDQATEQGFFMAPCIYGGQAQRAIIQEFADYYIDEFADRARTKGEQTG